MKKILKFVFSLLISFSYEISYAGNGKVTVEVSHVKNLQKSIKTELHVGSAFHEEKLDMSSFHEWKSSGWIECVVVGQGDEAHTGAIVTCKKDKNTSVAISCDHWKKNKSQFEYQIPESGISLLNKENNNFLIRLKCQ